MKYVKVPIFGLTELDEKTQEHVIINWRNDDYFHWGDDWRTSLDAFARKFSVVATVKDWEVALCRHSFITVEYSDAAEAYGWTDELSGVRLWKWLQSECGITHTRAAGHCELTGCFCDDDIMEPLYNFIDRPDSCSTLTSLLEACFTSWLRGYEADLKYWYSEQCICEDIAQYGTIFFENGDVCFHEPLAPSWPVVCWRRFRDHCYRLKSQFCRWLQRVSA